MHVLRFCASAILAGALVLAPMSIGTATAAEASSSVGEPAGNNALKPMADSAVISLEDADGAVVDTAVSDSPLDTVRVVETVDGHDALEIVEAEPVEDVGVPDPGDSGEVEDSLLDSGTSTSSGCITVYVKNREHSAFGALLYTYKTSTRWCWIRSTDRIFSVTTDWDYINDDPCWSWEGQVNKDTHYYDWASGSAPYSGYLHRRKGHAKGECIFSNNKYPENIIRSHSNGTWTWDTNG